MQDNPLCKGIHHRVRSYCLMNKRISLFCFLNCSIALILGMLVYVFLDSSSYFSEFVSEFINVSKFKAPNVFLSHIRNWGGDFLWSYALFFALYFSFRYKYSVIQTALISFVFSIIIELLQLIRLDNIRSGTFDIFDIVFSFFAILIGTIFLYLFLFSRKKKGG